MKPGKKRVATFSDVEKADHVKERLREAGIEAEVDDESRLQKYWFLSKPLAGEKVYVKEEDFPRAMHALEVADEEEHLLEGAVKCPKCESPRVEYPQFTRKFLTTTAVEVLCLMHILDRQFYCIECQHTWPVEQKMRKANDSLNWPTKDEGELVKKETL